MGKGDSRSRKGKIFKGSYGKTRLRKKEVEIASGGDARNASKSKASTKKKK